MKTGNLHDGWTCVKLGDVVKRTSKQCIPELNAKVRWIGADHLDEGDLSVRRWSTTDDPMFPPTFKFAVPSGSVLVHSRNPRKVAILRFDAITGEKLFCLSPVDQAELDSHFLAIQLQSDHFLEFVGRWLSGSVNKFLNWTALARYEFALPPVDEQQRIVELHKAHLAVADGLSRVEGTAEGLFDSVLRSVFAGAEGGAEWRALADVAEIQLGRMLSAERSTGPDLAPYIKNTNIQWDGLDLDELPMMSFPLSERSRYSLRAGDVLVCEGGDVGRSVLLEEDLDGVFYQKAVHRVRTTCLDPRYLYFYLVFAYRTGELGKLSTGTAIPHLPAERFRRLPVPVVSDDIQAAVAAKLKRARKVAVAARGSRESLVAQARVALRAALEGVDDVQ